jgi:hypothetical protein
MPFLPRVEQSFGFNDNILSLPGSQSPARGSRGDFTETTTVGGESKAYWSGQTFFVNGSVGDVRYLRNSSLDFINHDVEAGIDWTATERCSGKLDVEDSASPAPYGQQLGYGLNVVSAKRAAVSAKCQVRGGYFALANAGYTESTNSQGVNSLNDNRGESISAGLGYAVSDLTSLQVVGSASRTVYDGQLRQSLGSSLGTSNAVAQKDVTATLTRSLSSKVQATGTYGVTISGYGRTAQPHFSLSLQWTPTPKFDIGPSLSHSVGVASSVVANEQLSQQYGVEAHYRPTSKITLGGGFSSGVSSGANGNAALSAAVAGLYPGLTPGAGNVTTGMIHGQFSYAVTPFVTASLNVARNTRNMSNYSAPQTTVMATVKFAPF